VSDYGNHNNTNSKLDVMGGSGSDSQGRKNILLLQNKNLKSLGMNGPPGGAGVIAKNNNKGSLLVASKEKASKKDKDVSTKKGDRPESKFTKKGPTVTGASGPQDYQRYVLQGDADYNNINLIVEKNWDKVSEMNVLTQAGLDATASQKAKSKPATKKQDILIMYNKKNKPEICDTYSTDDGRQLNNNYNDYDTKKKTPKGKKVVRKGKSPSKEEYDSDTN
jgi:hypothetical protein